MPTTVPATSPVSYTHLDVYKRQIEGIGPTLTEIFQRAEREGATTTAIADRMARERLQGGL